MLKGLCVGYPSNIMKTFIYGCTPIFVTGMFVHMCRSGGSEWDLHWFTLVDDENDSVSNSIKLPVSWSLESSIGIVYLWSIVQLCSV